ncbi:MAG: DNA topoisomerase VI subunit B, partial [Candidatus Methanomethylophilaceae archaeon]|nr:DNA topoisomerase VI subunit B [Candidatus Methanomethylophilaceae archaeon]
YNYTSIPRTFRLHAHLPKECIKDLSIYSSPFFLDINEEGKANWEIRDIQPSANVTVEFVLTGEMAETFDADDIYFSGLNPVMVMGAEMLPGDWGIKGMEIIETEEDIREEEEESEMTEEEDLDDE